MADGQYNSSTKTFQDGARVPLQVDVNGKLITTGGTGSSSDQVQGNVAADAVDSGNPVKVGGVAINFTAPPAVAYGDRADIAVNPAGVLYVSAGIDAGTAGSDNRTGLYGFIGRAGGAMNGAPTPTAVGDFIFNGTGWDRAKKPSTTSRLLSAAATTNATSVKTSAGDLFVITGRNNKATPVYLKLYNKASAPTVGTDVPVQTHYIPATSNFTVEFANPLYFSTGIAYAITGAAADADTTALVAADVVCMNVSYQ